MKTKLDIPQDLKQFNSFFSKMAYRHDAARVFDDFLTVVVCCMAHQTEEKLYLETIKRYDKDELELLAKMFAELIMIYGDARKDERWIDPLGSFYEYLAGNSKKSALGQFFTPASLCDLMAQLTIGDDWGQNIAEPCSGSGRMILAANHKTKGNYYVCHDIDPICCKMTAINLCFHEIRAEVHCKDALRNEPGRFSLAVNYEYWKHETKCILFYKSEKTA